MGCLGRFSGIQTTITTTDCRLLSSQPSAAAGSATAPGARADLARGRGLGLAAARVAATRMAAVPLRSVVGRSAPSMDSAALTSSSAAASASVSVRASSRRLRSLICGCAFASQNCRVLQGRGFILRRRTLIMRRNLSEPSRAKLGGRGVFEIALVRPGRAFTQGATVCFTHASNDERG